MRQCRGCGVRLQSEDPKSRGYIPQQAGQEIGRPLVCQRCFRISHYGKDEVGPISPSESLTAVRQGIHWAQGLILVVDIMDFDAGLNQDLLDLVAGHRVFVALNKGDLLPPKTTWNEVEQWAKSQLQQRGVSAETTVVSASTGNGISRLLGAAETQGLGRLTVVGVTNVGKSTLISRLLKNAQVQGGGLPTVSRFPGTTAERIPYRLPGGLVLLDTPGIVPSGRLSDQLCPKCASELIPSAKVQTKLYPFPPGRAVAVRGYAALVCRRGDHKALVLGVTASAASWTKASYERLDTWLQPICKDCKPDGFSTCSVSVAANHDLVIHGLGWVSIRRSDLTLSLTIPRGTEFSIRPNLIGPK